MIINSKINNGNIQLVHIIIVLIIISLSGFIFNSKADNDPNRDCRSNSNSQNDIKTIIITGNDDFNNETGINNGTGVENDPYIIENWKFLIESDEIGISITNTDKHFIIRNCYFTKKERPYFSNEYEIDRSKAIVIDHVINGVILNCTFNNVSLGISTIQSPQINIVDNKFLNTGTGIEIEKTDDSVISRNIFSINNYGIYLKDKSSNILIENNTYIENENGISMSNSNMNLIYYNSFVNNTYGMVISDSPFNILKNNSLNNNGIEIEGDLIKHFTQDIDYSNKMNDKKILLLCDKKNEIIDVEVGQIIIAFCSDIIIENVDCNNSTTGIDIQYSKNIRILKTNIMNNKVNGISVFSASNILISNNEISNNENGGISLNGHFDDYCTNITIKYNLISANSDGILIHMNCNNNTIDNNVISNNRRYGININSICNNNKIINNLIKHNMNAGIMVEQASYSTFIHNNTCLNNTSGIALYNGASSSIISNNTLHNNRYGIASYDSELNIYENNTIFDNLCGIYFREFYATEHSKINIVKYNVIYHNQDFGVIVNNSYVDINASLNYWGDDSGPYHSINNPNGMGDNITDRIIFDPWLTFDGEQISLNNDPDNANNANNTDNNTYDEEDTNYHETQRRNLYIYSSIIILIVFILMIVAYLKLKNKSSY